MDNYNFISNFTFIDQHPRIKYKTIDKYYKPNTLKLQFVHDISCLPILHPEI